MVALEKMALFHKVGHELLSEDHHVVRFNFEGHATFADLAIDEELASLVLQSVFFLHEVLGKSLNLSLEQASELVELGVDDHFYHFVFVDLVLGFENVLGPCRFQIEQEEMRLQVAQILDDGVIDVFHVEFLELNVDSSLEQYLLLLVKMLEYLLGLADTI